MSALPCGEILDVEVHTCAADVQSYPVARGRTQHPLPNRIPNLRFTLTLNLTPCMVVRAGGEGTDCGRACIEL